MTDQDLITAIKKELITLKSGQVALDKKYRSTYHSGMGTFDLLNDIERVRKRQVELEDALRILAEFK